MIPLELELTIRTFGTLASISMTTNVCYKHQVCSVQSTQACCVGVDFIGMHVMLKCWYVHAPVIVSIFVVIQVWHMHRDPAYLVYPLHVSMGLEA